MTYDPERHHRRSIRLPHHDYSSVGAYYVTICTNGRQPLFGKIVGDEMRVNEMGRMVEICWNQLPEHFPHTQLDACVIMPDHIHGIVWIITNGNPNVGANNYSSLPTENVPPFTHPNGTSRTVGSMVRGFKIGVTMNSRPIIPTTKIWQRGYYERIIRNDADLQRIRKYIADNPIKWEMKYNRPLSSYQ